MTGTTNGPWLPRGGFQFHFLAALPSGTGLPAAGSRFRLLCRGLPADPGGPARFRTNLTEKESKTCAARS
jgi:hypothetical protein